MHMLIMIISLVYPSSTDGDELKVTLKMLTSINLFLVPSTMFNTNQFEKINQWPATSFSGFVSSLHLQLR